ncbi:hypothetical protein DFH09DRAFT_1365523 [Mycena vulgaris]|nr:hypothetical protein DFH09DRAFT_1365523 [Mycena vulgaris]
MLFKILLVGLSAITTLAHAAPALEVATFGKSTKLKALSVTDPGTYNIINVVTNSQLRNYARGNLYSSATRKSFLARLD